VQGRNATDVSSLNRTVNLSCLVSWPGAAVRDHTANVATPSCVRGFESHTHCMNDIITKTVTCRTCKREITIPAYPAEGHPYGWYYLTVNVPPWFNTYSDKPYRAIGLFCSVLCIANAVPEIETDENLHRQAYDSE
jgi:hypothetical protein